jgi:UDP-N-acetylenolpyruvoylglucosamine reductase
MNGDIVTYGEGRYSTVPPRAGATMHSIMRETFPCSPMPADPTLAATLSIDRDVPLQPYNTFGLAASARHYLRVTEPGQLARVAADPALSALPRLVLGGGSNLLLTRDVDALVLHMALAGRGIVADTPDAVLVRAGAGENWHAFVEYTLDQGLGGLENLALIPGTVGASPIQNIGAYGAELKDVFHSLTAFDFASWTPPPAASATATASSSIPKARSWRCWT